MKNFINNIKDYLKTFWEARPHWAVIAVMIAAILLIIGLTCAKAGDSIPPADPPKQIEINLKDVLMLTRNIQAVPARYRTMAGYCVSTLTDGYNDFKKMPEAKALVSAGKLHILMIRKSQGKWWKAQAVQYGIDTDSWHQEDAFERMKVLQNILDKALPPDADYTIEWWDERMEWRLYVRPHPADKDKMTKIMKLIQTVK